MGNYTDRPYHCTVKPRFTVPRFTGSPDLPGLFPFPRNFWYFHKNSEIFKFENSKIWNFLNSFPFGGGRFTGTGSGAGSFHVVGSNNNDDMCSTSRLLFAGHVSKLVMSGSLRYTTPTVPYQSMLHGFHSVTWVHEMLDTSWPGSLSRDPVSAWRDYIHTWHDTLLTAVIGSNQATADARRPISRHHVTLYNKS